MERSWGGEELTMRSNRAAGRAIVGIGVAVATETKMVTHVLSGTLRRSVHAAPAGEMHDEVEDLQRAGEDEADLQEANPVPHSTPTSFGPAVEVGSWLPYACVEWVGRMHPGVTQGLEAVRGMRSDRIVLEAFRQEGLA